MPVAPNGVDQRQEQTQLPPGKMLELVDVRQVEPGLYAKRFGYSEIDSNEYGATTLADAIALASTGRGLVQRTKTGLHVRSDELASWVTKEEARWASALPAEQAMLYGYRPTSVEAGGLIYYFAGNVGQHEAAQTDGLQVGDGAAIYNTYGWWHYRIVEKATGLEIVPETAIDTAEGWFAKPVVAGGFVWLFVGFKGAPGRYLYAVKFDPTAPEGTPAVTTYYDADPTAAGAQEIRGWDVMQGTNAGVVVAVVGDDLWVTGGATVVGAAISRLDTATGLPAAATGVVGSALSIPTVQAPVQWLKDTDGASIYFLYCGDGMADTHSVRVTSATLVVAADITLASLGAPTQVVGYRETSSGNLVTIRANPDLAGGPDSLGAYLQRWEHSSTGTQVSTGRALYQLCLASDPFEVDSRWYVIAQHDDNLEHVQAAYYLVDVTDDARIVGRALHGAGGDAGQRASYVLGRGNQGWCGVKARVDGTTVRCAVNSWDGTQYVTVDLHFVIDDPGLKLVRVSGGEELAVPSAWPIRIAGGQVVEYVPSFPRDAPTLTEVVPGGSVSMEVGYYAGYYRYALRDDLGNVVRSRTSPAGVGQITVANRTLRWTYDTLRLTNMVQTQATDPGRKGGWTVEFYLTEAKTTSALAQAATPYLQFAVPNYPTSAPVFFDMFQSEVLVGEALDTFNGAELAPDSPPSFRFAFAWGRRMVLCDTDRNGLVWISEEKENGFGYTFSNGLILELPGAGDSRVYCGGAIDDNYAALFTDDGTWIISGAGPDRRGAGMYEPLQLVGKRGCTNPQSLATTPAGLAYQDSADGRLYMLSADGRRTYIGHGVEDHAGSEVQAAVYDQEAQQLRVFVEGQSTPLTDFVLTIAEAVQWPQVEIGHWDDLARVVVVGGLTMAGTASDECAVLSEDGTQFNPPDITHPFGGSAGVWRITPNPGNQAMRLADCGVVVAGEGLAYNYGGRWIQKYDHATDTWVSDPDGPTTSGLAVNKSLFFTGLPDGSAIAWGAANAAKKWSSVANTWSAMADWPTTISTTVSLQSLGGFKLSDGRYFVYRGTAPTTTTYAIDWSIYDPGTDAWSAVQTYTVAKLVGDTVTVTVVPLADGAAMGLASIENGVTLTNRCFRFDGAAWSESSAVPAVARKVASFNPSNLAGGYAGEAFLVGGYTDTASTTRSDRIDKYDAATDTWSLFQTMAESLSEVTAIINPSQRQSYLWCVGGRSAAAVGPTNVPAYAVTTFGEDEDDFPCPVGMPSGGGVTCLVFDMRNPPREAGDPADALGQWYEWRLPGDPVDACVHEGAVHYLDSAAVVRHEVEDQYDDEGEQILTKIHYAPLFLARLGGAQHVYRVHFLGQFGGVSSHRLTALIARERQTAPVEHVVDFDLVDETLEEFEFIPKLGGMTSLELTLEEVESESNTEGLRHKLVTLELGGDGTMRRLNTNQRI